jgi:predicted regulator of Ras-like GTPase activity (Roadblock/LC7/MglB family)
MSSLDATLNSLMTVSGALVAAVVDYNSGLLLGSRGNALDVEVAAAGNTEVVRAKMRTMKELGILGGIEDMLITLDNQYHIIRPCQSSKGLFIYLVINRETGNLALARRKVQEADQTLVV